MNSGANFRSAGVWGLCFIASSVYLFLGTASIERLTTNATVWLISLEGAIFLFALTFALHLRGFIYLGREIGSIFIVRATQVMLATFALVEVLSMISILLRANNQLEQAANIDNFVNCLLVAFLSTAVAFGVVLGMQYKRLGILAIGSAFVGLCLLVMWIAWPAILLAIPSSALFFKLSGE